MKNVAKRVMSLCLTVLVMSSMLLVGEVKASVDVSGMVNHLSGLTAESFSPASSQVGTSNSAASMGTLLTDGKYDITTGEYKWYVSWAPNAGSHVQYALNAATELNTVVIYAGQRNGSNNYQDFINANEVTISYDSGDGTWNNVTNVSSDDKIQDTTPPQVVTFSFDTVTVSKIKIFIQNSAAFRIMEIEAYYIPTENRLFGLTAESFSPASSQVGTSNSATSMGTLLTDGKMNYSGGENKWYVQWSPSAGSHVQYSLPVATKINTVVIYAGQRNGSNNYQDLINADEVTISYDSGDGTWKNLTNVFANDKRQDKTPPQVLTFIFDTVTVSKIRIFIQNSAAFRIMEIEAYNIVPEYFDANGNSIESYQLGDTVVCKIKLGEIDNFLFIMALKSQNEIFHFADIGEYIGDGYWRATVTIPEDIVNPYIECFAWEKDTLKPIMAMMEF